MRTEVLNTMTSKKMATTAQQLRDLVDDTERLLRAAMDTGDEKLESMREDLTGQIERMRQHLDNFENEALHRMASTLRKADRTVHKHPYLAMGIVATLGGLFAILTVRR